MKAIDLHAHTNASDGTLSPSELVDLAVSKGLSALAITDHDTTGGIKEAMERASYHRSMGTNIEIIPGIEFSSEYQGRDIHIVGLFIDYDGEYFLGRIKHFADNRTKRNLEMCRRLTAHGMRVDYEELLKANPDSSITRAHFARFLMEHGYVKSIKEAFDRYIGDRCPCFVPRKKISPFRALEIIRKAGGFPVLAHPVLYGLGKEALDTLVRRLKEMGLGGIEAIYSTYTPSDERDIRALAKKYNLCISGGSDFHGKNKENIDLGTGLGHLFVPEDLLTEIRASHQVMNSEALTYQIPKILFTDLDGTLLRSDKKISSFTLDVLKRWVQNGHFIALCSGRDINSVNLVAEELNLPKEHLFTIGYNGGQIFDNSAAKTIFRCALRSKEIKFLSEAAKEAGLYMHTYSDTHIVSPGACPELDYYTRVIKTPVLFSEDITKPLGGASCKCILINIDDKDKLEAFRIKMAPWAKEHGISMMYSNPFYLEFIPSDSGKGRAVRELCKLCGIPGVMAVTAGDEANDISMLEEGDIAIAMKNGIDSIKDVSTLITDEDNDHDGLALALEGIM